APPRNAYWAIASNHAPQEPGRGLLVTAPTPGWIPGSPETVGRAEKEGAPATCVSERAVHGTVTASRRSRAGRSREAPEKPPSSYRAGARAQPFPDST